MKLAYLAATAALALSGAAFAQTSAADHAGHHPPGASGTAGASGSAAATPLADGEVRKVDRDQGKLTLKHGPIASLDMPAMTMVFKVSEARMLDTLKPGDKVRFGASNLNGALTVTTIEAAK